MAFTKCHCRRSPLRDPPCKQAEQVRCGTRYVASPVDMAGCECRQPRVPLQRVAHTKLAGRLQRRPVTPAWRAAANRAVLGGHHFWNMTPVLPVPVRDGLRDRWLFPSFVRGPETLATRCRDCIYETLPG